MSNNDPRPRIKGRQRELTETEITECSAGRCGCGCGCALPEYEGDLYGSWRYVYHRVCLECGAGVGEACGSVDKPYRYRPPCKGREVRKVAEGALYINKACGMKAYRARKKAGKVISRAERQRTRDLAALEEKRRELSSLDYDLIQRIKRRAQLCEAIDTEGARLGERPADPLEIRDLIKPARLIAANPKGKFIFPEDGQVIVLEEGQTIDVEDPRQVSLVQYAAQTAPAEQDRTETPAQMEPDTGARSSAFMAGRAAALRGEPVEPAPYDLDTQAHLDWYAGHEDAGKLLEIAASAGVLGYSEASSEQSNEPAPADDESPAAAPQSNADSESAAGAEQSNAQVALFSLDDCSRRQGCKDADTCTQKRQCSHTRRQQWLSGAYDHLLGTMSDREMGELAGVSLKAARLRRQRKGIAVSQATAHARSMKARRGE